MKTNYKQLISILAAGYVAIILMFVFENIGIGNMASIIKETNNSQNNSPSNTKIQSPTPTIPVKSKSPVAGKTETETKSPEI